MTLVGIVGIALLCFAVWKDEQLNIECDVKDHSLTGLNTKVGDPRVCWCNAAYVAARDVWCVQCAVCSVQWAKIAESTLQGFSSDLYFSPPLLSLWQTTMVKMVVVGVMLTVMDMAG